MKLIKIGQANIVPKLNNDLDQRDELLKADSMVDGSNNTVTDNNPPQAVSRPPVSHVRIEEETIDTPKRFYVGAPVESVSVSYLDPNHKTIKAERKAAEKEAKRLAKQQAKENKAPAKRGRPRAPLNSVKYDALMRKCDVVDKSDFFDDMLRYQSELYDRETGQMIASSYWDEENQQTVYTWA